jgi:16S rRNA G527 N7-methylase RsmG
MGLCLVQQSSKAIEWLQKSQWESAMNRTMMLTPPTANQHFAGEIAGVVARSVALLDAIESTVTSLAGHTEVMALLANQGRRITEEVAKFKGEALIDAEAVNTEGLQRLTAKLLADYHDAIERRNSARNDHQLTADDGVEEAWTNHIAALADLHNVLEDLRDTVETVDSTKSTVIGSFSNIDDLFAALDAD